MWHIGFLRDCSFLDWPDGFTSFSIKGINESLLTHLHKRFDRLSVHNDIYEIGVCWEVIVPQSMVDSLEVPDALSALDLNSNDCF